MAVDPSQTHDLSVYKALTIAYRYLAARDRTVAELRARLERGGVADDVAQAAIAELQALGYLDDASYATRFTADRRRLDRWGDDRIEQRLLALGVSYEQIATALTADRPDGESELDAALAVLQRRFKRPPQNDRERGRALGLLIRRGYDLQLAHDAIRALEQSGR